MVGLAEVTISSGSGILERVRKPFSTQRHAPNVQQPAPRSLSRTGREPFGKPLDTGAGGSPILLLSFPETSSSGTILGPQECAADTVNGDLYTISYDSNTINVVHVDSTTHAMSLLATYKTDATGFIGYSGGSATILGEAWDSTDGGLIIATTTGYELYSGARATTPNKKIKQIVTINPAENFGYNATTNQIWSPSYLGGDLDAEFIDVASSSAYNQNPLPGGYSVPDHGAIDSKTNIAVTAEEFEYTFYLVPLSQNVLGSGTFTNPNAVTATMTTNQDNGCCPVSDISIDSASHLLFSDVEFGSGVGVVQLPSTGSGTPALGDYVFAPLPAQASSRGVPDLPGDPHAIATFNLTTTGPYGLTFTSDYSTVIVSDMRKTLAATRNPSDPHGTTLTLGTNIFYITI
jgi:hypothetical protein